MSTSQFGAYGPAAAGPQVTHASGKSGFADPDLSRLSENAGAAADSDWSARIPNHSLYGIGPAAKPTAPNKDLWFRDIGITTTEPVLEKKIWSPVFTEFERHRRWGETYYGRLAMRSISRFVVGTAFFSVGTLYGRTKLQGYNNYERPKTVLQNIARFVDNTAGKAIEGGVYAVTHDRDKAQKAIMFRDTLDLGYLDHSGNAIKGRSLGHEAVGITFNFASMSFGDYLARYFLGLFDKNANTGWVKDSHLSISGGIKEFSRALFKGVTYAMGEDMFAAIPYVYFGKAQSKLMDKVDPGFQTVFDRSMMGSGVKLNDKGQAIGGDKLEGVIGFTSAFTVYNILTKMYRDLYATVQERLSDLSHGRRHEGRNRPSGGIIGFAKRAATYFAVTITKISFIAIPSSFLFGTLRVPQIGAGGRVYVDEQGNLSSFTVRNGHPAGHRKPWFVSSANNLRDVSERLGNLYSRRLRAASEKTGIRYDKTDRIAHDWANAAIAYTPYFMAKSDLMGPFLDTNRSNFVLAGFYSSLWSSAKSLFSFDRQNIRIATNETKKWWNEVLLAVLKQPSPNFESEIQREMENTSYKASLEAYDIYQGSSGYKVIENAVSPRENRAVRDDQSYVQRYPGRDPIITSPRPDSFTELVRPKGPIVQKSLIDRVVEGASDNQGVINK